MLTFKQDAVDGNVKGVEFLFKKNKIDSYIGAGRVAAPGKVEVTGADGKTQTLDTKSVVIATGSDVARLKGIEIDEERIVSSTGALSLPSVPKDLLVIGAGVIGLELGPLAPPRRQASPWSSSWTARCPAWTVRCVNKPSACSKSRA